MLNPIRKQIKRNLDGILILDKPSGITSNRALQIAKRLFLAEKAGHTGSLDPLASGLLPICFGEATKFSRFLLDSDKHYRFTAKLGIKTDSGDSEGTIIEQKPIPVLSLEMIEQVLAKFRGKIQQTPPMYSALKHQGQPLYKLARQGLAVDRAAREVSIYQLTLVSFDEDELTLEVKASKGTYVRTLAEDIGEALGCGAHVVMLRRLAAGPYTESQMIPLSLLEGLASDNLNHYLLPIDTSVLGFPQVRLSESAAFHLSCGQIISVSEPHSSGWVRLVLENEQFLGMGEILGNGRVAPRRLLVQVSKTKAVKR